jgi:hypothetical protein
MSSFLPVASLLLTLPMMQYGGMDMAAAQKWASAKVVKYRVEGVHKARAPVVFGDYEGKGDVTDRITVEFTWDVQKQKIISPVTVVDAKSEVANLKSDGTNCGPPQLKGEYEHFQSVSHSVNGGQQIEIKGTRTYPAASVSNYPASCSMRAVAGKKEAVRVYLAGAGPEGLGLPVNPAGPMWASADRKSFSLKGAENWVWTFTPTLVSP